jgi:predicted RND superfamily exporter protein
VEHNLSGLFPLEIDLKVDEAGRFYEEDFVRRLAEVQRFAGEQNEVVFQRSYLNLHAEVSPPLRDSLMEPNAELPRLQSAIDRSRTRLKSAAEEMGYSAFMTPDKTRARLLLKVRDEGTHRLGMLIDRLDARLGEMFPQGSGVTYQLTGDAYVITKAMNQLIHGLMMSLVTASAVIFLIIGILFRSPRIGLMAAISNSTPLVLTLGYIAFRGYDLNAGNVIVFTISLGIVVDNTIHFIYRFQEENRLEPDVRKATRIALTTTGPAMVLTSLLIVGGLAVLLVSQFVPTRRFAELMIVTLGGAMVGDMLVLPACLVLLSPKPKPQDDGDGTTDSDDKVGEPATRQAVVTA